MNRGKQAMILKILPKGPKSWSHLEVWQTCKLQYWFRYGEKISFTRGNDAKFGSAFHDFRFRYFDHCRQRDIESDWDQVRPIAHKAFHDQDMPSEYWDEFYNMCRRWAEQKSFNPLMKIEYRFGINRDGTVGTFESCDGFRGILDGLEVYDDTGVVHDAKTTHSMDIPWTQIETYAAFVSLIYPEVKEWRLVYDFARFGRIREKRVLAENLHTMRTHAWAQIDRIEQETEFKAEPSESCLTCPFFGICDYRLSGVEAIADDESARKAIEDYFQHKARAEQLKRKLKKYVEVRGAVETERARAAFYTRETKTCDKIGLIKYLKEAGKNPIEYVEFPAESLRKLMKDQTISDDVGNFITIETFPQFDIRKRKKDEEGTDSESNPSEE